VQPEHQRDHHGRHHRHHEATAPGDGRESHAGHDRGRTPLLPREDQERARALYREEFGPLAAAHKPASGWDRGANVVGGKPDRSPGDTSDLPPTGEELVETADKEASRPEKLRNQFFKRLEDVDDSINDVAPEAQQILEQQRPTGHPAVVADVHSHWVPESVPDATPSVGSIAEVVLVLGVLADRAIHWSTRKVADKTGRG
jgi:hypothetical protein